MPAPEIVNSLLRNLRLLEEIISGTGDIQAYVERIRPYWRSISPSRTFARVVGIDGSLNSAEVFGSFTLFAVSAAAYDRSDHRLISGLAYPIPFYRTPHVDSAITSLMHAFEAFLAYQALRNGAELILLDGAPQAVFNRLLGIVAGTLNTLYDEIENVLSYFSDSVHSLSDVYNDESGLTNVGRKVINEALNDAIKALINGFDFRTASVKEEELSRILFENEPFAIFRSSLVSRISEHESLEVPEEGELNLEILKRRAYIEPTILAIAAFGLYVKSMYRLLENLKDSIIVGASKRIFRPGVELEGIGSLMADVEEASRYARAIIHGNLPVPGYIKILKMKLYQRSLTKVYGLGIEGIKAVSDYLEGLKDLDVRNYILKPVSSSVLRVQIISRQGVDDDRILSSLLSLIAPGEAGSSTLTFIPIELAHRMCSIDNETISKLAKLFYTRLKKH